MFLLLLLLGFYVLTAVTVRFVCSYCCYSLVCMLLVLLPFSLYVLTAVTVRFVCSYCCYC